MLRRSGLSTPCYNIHYDDDDEFRELEEHVETFSTIECLNINKCQSESSVRVKLEMGHTAIFRNNRTPTGMTHDWHLFLRGLDSDCTHFIQKVVFHLHNSFPKPRREIRRPPFEIKENGYGSFNLEIEVFFKNQGDPDRIQYQYDLFLREDTQPVKHLRCETLTFKHPNPDFKKLLLLANGELINDDGEVVKYKKDSKSPGLDIAKVKLPEISHPSGSDDKKSSRKEKRKRRHSKESDTSKGKHRKSKKDKRENSDIPSTSTSTSKGGLALLLADLEDNPSNEEPLISPLSNSSSSRTASSSRRSIIDTPPRKSVVHDVGVKPSKTASDHKSSKNPVVKSSKHVDSNKSSSKQSSTPKETNPTVTKEVKLIPPKSEVRHPKDNRTNDAKTSKPSQVVTPLASSNVGSKLMDAIKQSVDSSKSSSSNRKSKEHSHKSSKSKKDQHGDEIKTEKKDKSSSRSSSKRSSSSHHKSSSSSSHHHHNHHHHKSKRHHRSSNNATPPVPSSSTEFQIPSNPTTPLQAKIKSSPLSTPAKSPALDSSSRKQSQAASDQCKNTPPPAKSLNELNANKNTFSAPTQPKETLTVTSKHKPSSTPPSKSKRSSTPPSKSKRSSPNKSKPRSASPTKSSKTSVPPAKSKSNSSSHSKTSKSISTPPPPSKTKEISPKKVKRSPTPAILATPTPPSIPSITPPPNTTSTLSSNSAISPQVPTPKSTAAADNTNSRSSSSTSSSNNIFTPIPASSTVISPAPTTPDIGRYQSPNNGYLFDDLIKLQRKLILIEPTDVILLRNISNIMRSIYKGSKTPSNTEFDLCLLDKNTVDKLLVLLC